MPTNRKRKSRTAKGRIPANPSQEYLDDLEARDFLSACNENFYDPLSEEEAEILKKYKAAKRAKNAYK